MFAGHLLYVKQATTCSNWLLLLCTIKSHIQTNTFVSVVATKVNISYGTKPKCNQPLTFMNTLLICLTDLNMLNFAVTTHIVKMLQQLS